jgi:hypothetical protein
MDNVPAQTVIEEEPSILILQIPHELYKDKQESCFLMLFELSRDLLLFLKFLKDVLHQLRKEEVIMCRIFLHLV